MMTDEERAAFVRGVLDVEGMHHYRVVRVDEEMIRRIVERWSEDAGDVRQTGIWDGQESAR